MAIGQFAYASSTNRFLAADPGGLTSSQMLTFLEELADLNWVGMDCVGVARRLGRLPAPGA